jgi:membrane protein
VHISDLIKYSNYISLKLRRDAVAAYAAQSALFIIISFFPFIMLLLSLFQFLPLNEIDVQKAVTDVVPDALDSWAASIVMELYQKSSTALISVTAITTIWAASKGIHVLITGYDSVYGVQSPRNYFGQRFIAVLYTIIFLIALALAIVILVFGSTIFNILIEKWPPLETLKTFVDVFRSIGVTLILTLLFDVMYTVFPRRKTKFRRELPGAFLSAVGWYLFSFLFSIYIQHYGNYSYLYGSIAAVVLFVVWLYFCMYIMLIGAEVNEFLHHGMIADVLTETISKRRNQK